MNTPWRKLNVIAIAGAISWLGSELTTFAVILRDKDVVGPTGIALYLLCFGVPAIFMAPVSGWIADRFSSRQVILPSLSVMGLGSLSLAVGLPIWWTPFALVITSVAGTLVSPATQAAIVSVSSKEDVPRVTGLLQSINQVGMLFAPALGGFLVATTGYFWPFVIDAVSFWTLGLVFLSLNINRKSQAHEVGEKLSLSAGLKFVWSHGLIRSLMILISTLVIALSAFHVGEVFLVKDELHASTLIYGIVGALYATGSILGAALAAAIKLPAKWHAPTSIFGMLAISLAILSFSFINSWIWAMVLALITGIGSAFLNTYAISIIMTNAPEDKLGRVNAVVGAMISTGFVAGVIVSGPAISLYGVRLILLVGGLLSLLILVTLAPKVLRESRKIQAHVEAR